MQNQNFQNDNILNVTDNYQEDLNTSRTEELLYNSKKIDWRRDIYPQKQNIPQSRLNGNSSSVVLPDKEHSSYNVESALETNSNCNLSISCDKNSLSYDDSLSSDLTPRSQFFNDKARQNIDNFLPKSFKYFDFTNDSNQKIVGNYNLCPECNTKNSSDLDWCLSCGLYLINQKKPNSFKSNQNLKYSVENDTKPVVNNFPNLIIKDKENYSMFIENVEDFDRRYKRTDQNDDVKLKLSELELPASENQICSAELDIDLIDHTINKNNDSRISSKVPIVPPLDLSTLESNRASKEVEIKQPVKNIKMNQENERKQNRKWITSSMAWEDKPENLLKKKPAKYYRNKLNSCTNKMGLHVFQSKIPNSNGIMKDYSNMTVVHGSENTEFDLNLDNSYENHDLSNNVEKHHGEMLVTDDNCIRSDLHIPWIEQNMNNSNFSDLTSSMIVGECGVSNWQCLPAEIWIKIMLNLPHCDLSRLQQTCRRIYSIGLDSQLWRCVTLFRHNNLTDIDIINIARKMPKELHFKNCFGTSITTNGLKGMFHICGFGVEKISFISCSKGALEGDQFLVLSSKFCPNVTHINASYLMNLQDSTLISMTEGFNKIVSLNLMGAHAISNESIKSLIKKHRSSLTSLDLYGCFKLNSATLGILEECLNLKSLALGSINKLKRSSMVDLLRKLSQLTNLDLRGTVNLIDDVLLGQICMLCPNLQQIILTNSCLVGNEGLNSLANSTVSKTLKVLDVCGCTRITDKGAEAILKNCQSLEDLDISCTGITGQLTKLFKTYPPPSLKCLRVNNNKLISDNDLTSIVKSSKKLTTIYMCGITSIERWHSLESMFQHVLFKHE